MNLLITNDDGFGSPSLEILCSILSEEHDVISVAPAREQSAISQAISLHRSLSYKQLTDYGFPAIKVYGTPSDCVKFALCHLYRDRKFDLVISGVNPFENAGLSTLYSGTVAGAREGATWGIPSLALSVWDEKPERSEHAARWTAKLLRKPELLQLDAGVFWSVNFPACEPEQIQGARVSSMSTAMFKDHYLEYKTPRESFEYWLTGEKRRDQYKTGTDDSILQENLIAITPLKVNQTSRKELERLAAYKEELIAL